MRYRLLTVLALLAATVVLTPGTACACSCVPLKPAEQVTKAAAVFTGTVVASRPGKGEPMGPTPPVVYTLRADQVYKGEPAAEYQVATNADSAACGYTFAIGSRYLVFASDGDSGLFAVDPGVPLHTALCDGNLQVRPGEGPLRAQDGILKDEPLSAELLSALGDATRPRPAASPAPSTPAPSTPAPLPSAAPASSAGDSPAAPAVPWVYAGGAVALLGLVITGWRLTGRRRK
ncbi:hypothetical protein [Streptosporangium carneum]|uniref:Tissue inhibitor of metalloproteinase n=1 Tax=Streptosporangium carneum TaxID=47481 RepID=A0A9W6MC05_9ACTN|nr:hypothetical protein [Streptosporangium carneum]GLK08666.1 hypothetical protein GCM10017600_20710 [Streptosporangium carneum]